MKPDWDKIDSLLIDSTPFTPDWNPYLLPYRAAFTVDWFAHGDKRLSQDRILAQAVRDAFNEVNP